MKAYIKPLLALLPVIALILYFLSSVSNRSEFSETKKQPQGQVSEAFKNFAFTELNDWRGNSIQVGQMQEPIIIMHYWASWCAPCIHEFPDLIKMAQKSKGQVQVFAISEDKDKQEIAAFIKSFKEAETTENFHLIWDEGHKLMNDWQVTKLPESFIYGPKRSLVKHVGGVVNWTSADTAEYFKAIMESGNSPTSKE